MIDGDQRLIERERQCFRVADSDQQAPANPGPWVTASASMDSYVFPPGQRLADHRNDGAQVLARGEFRDDAPVRLMSRDLRSDNIRDDLLA